MRNQKFTLNASEKRVYDGCKNELNIREQNAVEMARFVSQFQKELLGDQKEGGVGEKREWTQNEVMILAREVLAEKAATAKEEREILEHQLELLKVQRGPMLEKLCEIEKSADRSARRALWGIASIFVSQFAMIQYGTYIAFSWDIMEPITCGMTLGDAICSYFFWLWSGRPYTLDGLKLHFYKRRERKLIKKDQIDYENFLKTEEAIRIIKDRLKELD